MSTIDVHKTYQKATHLITQNFTKHGITAAHPEETAEKPLYQMLFPRDVAISILGLLADGRNAFLSASRAALITLLASQSERGQFPQSYDPDQSISHWWSPGTIDSTIWWGIACLEYVARTGDTDFYDEIKSPLERAFVWLTYQDTNNDSLLEQGVASSWDDEMPRHGTVLSTNALWYWFVGLRIAIENRDDLKSLRHSIHEGVNTLLWVHKAHDQQHAYIPDNAYTRKNTYATTMIEWSNSQSVYLPYYLGFSAHREYEARCDVFGNILACLTGLADAHKARLFTDFVFRAGINQPYPVKVMYPPIYPGENEWRPFMAKGRQNYPWQYHNGGIWPFVGGFWVWWLSGYDRKLAEDELFGLAQANNLNEFEFNEYLNGLTGTPMGIPRQTWSMAMYIKAYRSLHP